MRARARATGPLTALALVAAAGLCACGTTTSVRIPGHTIHLLLDEYRIRPDSVSVPPGVLKIEASNVGQLTHNVVVEGRQADGSGNPADQMGGVTTLHPGQAGASPKLRLDPGHYVLASTLSNQADLGMTAQLVVRARP